MKVPDNILFSIFQEQDARIRKNLSDKTLEISTGRKYQGISEDPPATYNVLDLKKGNSSTVPIFKKQALCRHKPQLYRPKPWKDRR